MREVHDNDFWRREGMVEYFFVVNEDDDIIRKATREECHSNRKLIHRSVCIFVVNDKNEVFLQKRSMFKDLYPGYFTGSATGHVNYSEDYDEAARRELKEELGIDAPLLQLGKFKNFTEEEREMSMVYICHFNGPFNLNTREITDGAFFSIEDIKRSIKTGDKKFPGGFKVDFKELLKHVENVDRKD
jgi:isopentenyl-diphosphate delta-isomerase type 1